jgi:hypothetical protein
VTLRQADQRGLCNSLVKMEGMLLELEDPIIETTSPVATVGESKWRKGTGTRMPGDWQPIEGAPRAIDVASNLTQLFTELSLSLRCVRSDLARRTVILLQYLGYFDFLIVVITSNLYFTIPPFAFHSSQEN